MVELFSYLVLGIIFLFIGAMFVAGVMFLMMLVLAPIAGIVRLINSKVSSE